MATRFYFYPDYAGAAQPSVATWGALGTAVNVAAGNNRANVCATRKHFRANVVRGQNYNNALAGINYLMFQYVSPPIAAITIAGTVKGQVLARQSTANANVCTQFRIYVVSNDGATVRGVLLDFDNSALTNEFPIVPAQIQNRKIPRGYTGSGTAMSPVNALTGDRIVIDVGFRTTPPDNGAYTVDMYMGAPTINDLPEDETTNDASGQNFNSWVEISDTLVFTQDPISSPYTELMHGGQLNPTILEQDVLPASMGGAQIGSGGTGDQDQFQQRIFDTTLNAWCYYVKSYLDPNPGQTQTQPNHTNNLLPGSHQVLGIRVVE